MSLLRFRTIQVNSQNYDLLQILELPADQNLNISVTGKGEALAQVVLRYNVPQVDLSEEAILKINVDYDAGQVEVNDEVGVSVDLSFNPPEPLEAGMTIVDVSVPTGFAAVRDTVEAAVKKDARIKRFEISGRKVIFYIENLFPGDTLSFEFKVKALYPVKAKGVTSQAYSYYKPEISAESLGHDITVVE